MESKQQGKAGLVERASGAAWASRLMPLTQCRSIVGVKPSPSKTCPKCPPHEEHMISTRRIPSEVSVRVTTEPETILSKAGHPHPLSNLAAAE